MTIVVSGSSENGILNGSTPQGSTNCRKIGSISVKGIDRHTSRSQSAERISQKAAASKHDDARSPSSCESVAADRSIFDFGSSNSRFAFQPSFNRRLDTLDDVLKHLNRFQRIRSGSGLSRQQSLHRLLAHCIDTSEISALVGIGDVIIDSNN